MGHQGIVALLLRHPKVDPADDGNYPIRFAAANGHLKIVSLLMKHKRADPSDFGNMAIKSAAKNGHAEIVRILLQDKRVLDDSKLLDMITSSAYFKESSDQTSMHADGSKCIGEAAMSQNQESVSSEVDELVCNSLT
jgi:ankyrin repeat protein